jgi:4-hydroxy-3-methylbut-2-enyl diphosphate reductase
MKVIRADAMGMCFGVRDALATARALPDPEFTTIYGELVHNAAVGSELAARGFWMLGEAERDRPLRTAQVLVTAHGLADRDRAALERRGHRLVDTTCPLVRHAHQAARALAAEGRHVLVLGRHGHVEVRGLVGDLPSWSVVETEADVQRWPHARLGIVCQTTMAEADSERLRAAVAAANPGADIAFRDTICEPTRQRQRAVRALVEQVDAVVVVGGRNSNNTRQLVAACAAAARPTFHVEGPAEVDVDALRGFAVVGLTAGTSTEDATIDAVEAVLTDLGAELRPSAALSIGP